MSPALVLEPSSITLGILAGGRAERLGGRDKAWIRRDGVAQVERWHRKFRLLTAATLVSANANHESYLQAGLSPVCDHVAAVGPLGGLEALAATCQTEWMVTLPVDVVHLPEDLLASLATARARDGAFARDCDGVQPLVALWRVEALRHAALAALQSGATAVHAMQASLRMSEVAFSGHRFGNLNTPADLLAAGCD